MAKRCKECKGKKVVRNNKMLSVEIDKGSPDGEQFTIHGEGDQVPETEAGDVIAVIKVKDNKSFTRKGADLEMKKEITLLESLTGANFSITHLDGTVYKVSTKEGKS